MNFRRGQITDILPVGCSFTFEQALADAGLVPRHQEVGRNVPMYRTTLQLLPSGSEYPPPGRWLIPLSPNQLVENNS